VTPSHLLAKNTAEPAMRSPRRARHKSQFLRGNIIHKLLEVLPEFQTERRRDIAQTLVRGYPELKDGQGQMIIDEVFAVLENPEFTEIFAAGSRAEISLAGSAKTLPEGLYPNPRPRRLLGGMVRPLQTNRPCACRTHIGALIYLEFKPVFARQRQGFLYWVLISCYLSALRLPNIATRISKYAARLLAHRRSLWTGLRPY